MSKNFVEELRWRGMVQDIMPGTEEQLQKEMTTGYAGFDPTADSLGIGNLVPVMLLKQFQLAGHKPIALLGGATALIGDPSGKSEERNFISKSFIDHNLECQKKQLEKFLDFSPGKTQAEIVNNDDWYKDMNLFYFMREIGKVMSMGYMLSKDTVKRRIETGISYTEFSYQLFQALDFHELYLKGCFLQMGGSDQWGNMTSGVELIRKLRGPNSEAFALTCPLITKADGTKFGKTESGNIWIDAKKTSPYKFYQFWLNAADEDVKKYIRIFTLLGKEEIESLEIEHDKAPHLRLLQKKLAEEITVFVHSKDDLLFAQKASEILFGQSTAETLFSLSDNDFKDVFEGVPSATINKSDVESGIPLMDLIVEKTKFFPSKGEAKRTLQGNGFSLNKTNIAEAEYIVKADQLINGKYLLLQKGKKNYFLVVVE